MSDIGIDALAAHAFGPPQGALTQPAIPRFRQPIYMAVIFSPPGPSLRRPPCRNPILLNHLSV